MCEPSFLSYESREGERTHKGKPANFCVPSKRYLSLQESLYGGVLAGGGATAAVVGGSMEMTSLEVQT